MESGLISFFSKIYQEPLGRKWDLLSYSQNIRSTAVVVFLQKRKFPLCMYIQMRNVAGECYNVLSFQFHLYSQVNPVIIYIDCTSNSLKINPWKCFLFSQTTTSLTLTLSYLPIFFLYPRYDICHRQNVFCSKLVSNWKCYNFDTLWLLWLKDSMHGGVSPLLFLWCMHLNTELWFTKDCYGQTVTFKTKNKHCPGAHAWCCRAELKFLWCLKFALLKGNLESSLLCLLRIYNLND